MKNHFEVRKCKKIFFDFFCYDSPVAVFKKHCYFSIMSIVTRLALPKNNFQYTVFDVKFSAGSIPIVRIYIYIDKHLKILIFLFIFNFLAFPCFISLFWVQIRILREILHGIKGLEKIFHFSVSKNKNRKNRWKRYKILHHKSTFSSIFKFSVESKSALRIGVKNKGKPGNRK